MKNKRSFLMGRAWWLMLAIGALSLLSPRAVAATAGVGDYYASVPLTTEGYAGSSSLANFPLLVRVSPELIDGFDYAVATTDGAPNIRFYSSSGALLASDCDTWNPEGESLFWVRVPSLTATTSITLCWHPKAGVELPDCSGAFADYTGVWHMDEAKDSSPNNARSTFGPQRQAVEGILGGASGAVTTGTKGAHLVTDYYPALDQCTTTANGTGFTVSMWVKLNATTADWSYLFSRKQKDDYGSWGMQFNGTSGNTGNIRLYTSNGSYSLGKDLTAALATTAWHKFDAVIRRTSTTSVQYDVYIDGAFFGTKTLGNVNTVNGSLGFSIGGLAGDGHGLVNGSTDECRLSRKLPSADWIKAEYDQVVNDDFVTYGDPEIFDVTSIDDVTIAYKGAEATWVGEEGAKELVLKFTDPNDVSKLLLPNNVEAWVLAVGGGGAGANAGAATMAQGGAGGGGAGGYVENETLAMKGGEYTIAVGAGGVSPTVQNAGGDGLPSYIQLAGADVMRAAGGGGGGIKSAGRPGGSGGGGSTTGANGNTGAGGAATPAGQGNAGGKSYHQGTSAGQTNSRQSGAGGGGAGGPGAPTSANNVGAAGGDGKTSTITGDPVVYAAGGGGGSRTGTPGPGGSDGVGGHGGGGTSAALIKPEDGAHSTGSGGGGGCYNSQPGGAGGSGVVIIRIKKVMPTKPETSHHFGWSGEEYVVYPGSEKVVITKGGATVDKVAAKDAGTHVFQVKPATGYTWGDGTIAPVTVTIVIDKAKLSVKSFTIDGWQVGEVSNEPQLVVVDVNGNEVTLSNVSYFWGSSAAGPAAATQPWSTKPSEAGEYVIRAEFAGTSDFDAPETMPSATFTLWDGSAAPDPNLGYHAVLTLSGYTGAAPLTDFPMLVRLKENEPLGFHYSQAKADGSDLRFYAVGGETPPLQGEAQPLPYEIDTWNPEGESLIWVKVPSYQNGPVAQMAWGELAALTPAPDPSEVWTNYHGVWHVNEEIDASRAATAKSLDSTANHLDATPTKGNAATANLNQMVSLPGVVGNGRVNSTVTSVQNGNRLQTARVVDHGESFTVSGWFRMNEAKQYPRLFGTKNNNDAPGFSVEAKQNSTAAFAVRSNKDANGANNAYGNVQTADLLNNWVYITVVYDGTFCRFYSNGERPASGVVQIPACAASTLPLSFGANGNGGEWSLNGAYDELRWAKTALTADWIKAEYEQMAVLNGATTGSSVTWGPTIQTPDATFVNRWLVEPVLPATEWGTGMEPAITCGTPAYGGPAYFVITSIGGEELTNTFPTNAGAYTITFKVDAGSNKPAGTLNWTGLATPPVAVTVTKHTPVSDLAGTAGSATLSGRVLLANNEPGTVAPITDQDYDQTVETSPAIYWEHGEEEAPSAFPNLRPGTTHRLIAGAPVNELNQATTIWTLADVYLGTTYNPSANVLQRRTRNLMPYSATSATGDEGAMFMVMRNVVDASVVSPCYMNGVGTVYFDAVNAWTEGAGEGNRLVVEMLTGGDALAETVDADKWEPVELLPIRRDVAESPDFVKLDPTLQLDLAITNGQYTAESFYRVAAKIESHEPVRFRIRRATVPLMADGTPRYPVDAGGFILLDNIVVSYPAMRADLSAFGKFDATRVGKETLGYENAFDVPFPGLGDTVHPRATASFYTNPGFVDANTNEFITAANLHYRWRYLEQQANPWETVALDTTTLKAPGALNLKNAAGEELPGDIEFWFDLTLNAPFYKYVDYAGVSGFTMSDYYSEEITAVTNRASGTVFASRGSDWFVRLREGKSNLEGVKLVLGKVDVGDPEERDEGVASPGGGALGDATPSSRPVAIVQSLPFELIGNHIWRGYLKTPSATNYVYRLEFENEQTPGSELWATNTAYWASADVTSFPVSEILTEGTADTWKELPIDGATGYLMFQIDDSTKSITVVHADYMNFNQWNDAKKDIFVGSSTEDEGKSGVSPKAIACEETFNTWNDMPITKPNKWSEPFQTTTSLGVNEYETFPSIKTPNGWQAGQGMYVYSHYRDATKVNNIIGRSLQMEGQGRGYIQFVDAADSPRGLESISFTARMGQFIEFNDFSYFDAPEKAMLTNYTFTARGAYDTNSNKDFSGNASLSLVAYYRPGIGAYEFRLEQSGANRSNNNVTGANVHKQRLSLYKWVYDQATGQMNQKLLGAHEWSGATGNPGEGMVANTGLTGKFSPLYISVSNDVTGAAIITAGMMKNGNGVTASDAYSKQASSTPYINVAYKDATDPLKGGTYGVVSANCPGVFLAPFTFDHATDAGTNTPGNNGWKAYDLNLTFPSSETGIRKCLDDLYYERWMVTPGRMETFCVTETNTLTQVIKPVDDPNHKWGIRARKLAPQAINVYTAPKGSTEWTLLATTNVATFGSAGQPGTKFTFPLYRTDDCSVKIAAAGTFADVRRDVVIDDIELKQFRGASWEHVDVQEAVPGWLSDEVDALRRHTNFVFTTAWIQNHAIKLSAKRTDPDFAKFDNYPSAIRSPLFDGMEERGIGLGMFSFSYRNAQDNAKLLLQIATNNVEAGTLSNLNGLREDQWTTVTNFTFSGLSAAERASGTRSCYLGLHGVTGVMRLVVDPDLVRSVANVKDPTKFGEIEIDSVFCRDEPVLDHSCWWGWNLRTVGADAEGRDKEGFMYLPDSAELDPSQLGLSLALNNSRTDKTDPTDVEKYKQHLPFVQTPTFATNLVGEVTFRARKYDTKNPQPAQVLVFGSRNGDEHGRWTPVTELGSDGREHEVVFIISNNTYTTYTLKTRPTEEAYAAFRLVVTGVEGVSGTEMGNRAPEGYDTPVRVLLDEIVVSEAVRARVGFRNVGAFRSKMTKAEYVPDVPSEKEQPLCNEGWGIECEVFAAQLPDEIDFTREPRVRLHWFEGKQPWGYANWRTNSLAKSAWLTRATDTEKLVYRSTYAVDDGASVIGAVSRPGTTVQYMLEVQFYQVGQSEPVTNWLMLQDWQKPEWYDPVDYQADYAEDGSFAAYCILDTVAPHWAWINEANIFGEYDEEWQNTDQRNQYIEVAVPAEADITGWYVNLITVNDASIGAGHVTVNTNRLATFGDQLAGVKPGLIGAASNMVFRVLASPATVARGKLKESDGTLDAMWESASSSWDAAFSVGGEINAAFPVGVQLVRGSEIVEHEVMFMGTNIWNEVADETTRLDHDPTNTVRVLNEALRGSHFFYAGDDCRPAGLSRGVFIGRGETAEMWNGTMIETPGRINQGQQIDPDHPTPNGEEMKVFLNLDWSNGPIYQTVGDAVLTNALQILSIQKGKSTNVTYRVGAWHDFGQATMSVGTAGGKLLTPTREDAPPEKGLEPYCWTVTVGGPAYSNNLTVVASAKVRSDIDEKITDPRFREAVIDWLSGGKTLRGDFEGSTDEIKAAKYISYGGSVTNDLTLTEMYWLDLDPTIGDLAFVAGICAVPVVKPATYEYNTPEGTEQVTVKNVRLDMSMMFTNLTEDVTSEHYGEAWRPYVMRGITPGSTSLDPGAVRDWEGATFKVTGVMLNGRTDTSAGSQDYLPVRWFVFDEDSFGPETGPDPFKVNIEVDDPHCPASPGYDDGWGDYPDKLVFFGWAIDMRRKPQEVEVLRKKNDLSE